VDDKNRPFTHPLRPLLDGIIKWEDRLTLAAPRFSMAGICSPRRSSCRSLRGFKDDLEYAINSGVSFILFCDLL
jgi:hypothetical protein